MSSRRFVSMIAENKILNNGIVRVEIDEVKGTLVLSKELVTLMNMLRIAV